MEIRGIDFTSAPSRRKPITVARGIARGGDLVITRIDALPDFAAFERMLAEPGPWVGGFDFPFGQPRRVIEALGWPPDWAGYVGGMAERGKAAFEADIGRFIAEAPPGGKRPQRAADRGAGAHSPVKLHYQPVGRMFFQGAQRLLAAGVSIPGLRETDACRIAVEAYPALVARAAIRRISYKSDRRDEGSTHGRAEARRAIVEAVERGLAPYPHRVRFAVPEDRAGCLADGSGDRLDAVLAALQAAWAAEAPRYGAPATLDPLEGFIADPGLGEAPASPP